MATLSDYVLDAALAKLDTEANRLDVCSQEPTSYIEATSTYTLGNKTSISVGTPENRSPNGRKTTVAAVSGGVVTDDGTATHWAISDTEASRLLATGALVESQELVSGDQFALASFDIGIKDAVSS